MVSSTRPTRDGRESTQGKDHSASSQRDWVNLYDAFGNSQFHHIMGSKRCSLDGWAGAKKLGEAVRGSPARGPHAAGFTPEFCRITTHRKGKEEKINIMNTLRSECVFLQGRRQTTFLLPLCSLFVFGTLWPPAGKGGPI